MRVPLLGVGVAAALVVVAALAFQAWSSAHTLLSYTDLKSDPAYALRMPAADELARVGGDARTGIDGSTPAFAGHIFGTMATSADVYAYYESELARLGWHTQPPPFSMSTDELENRLYCKPKASFRLAIKNKDTAFQPAFYRGRAYVTVFDATLITADPESPCPRQAPSPSPAGSR